MVLLSPLLLLDVPPLLDYPNHLARAYVLAVGSSDPALSEFYRPHWSILPNLATDAILVPLLRVLPAGTSSVHLAGRVVAGVFLILPVLGSLAYSRAVFERPAWWPLVCGCIAYNAAFLQGFLNFSASIGLALLCASVWKSWRQTFPARTIAIAAVTASMLFFCHLMGLGFFLLLVGAAEIEAAWDASQASSKVNFAAEITRRALTSLPVLVAPILFYSASEFGRANAEARWRSAGEKLSHLLDPVINYNLTVDRLTAVAIVGCLILAALIGRVRIPLASGLVLVALLALYVATPFDFKGTAALDMRFVILAAFMLFAGVLPSLPHRVAWLAPACFAALFMTRMAILGTVWSERGTDLAELRQTIASVPAGSRVYLSSTAPATTPDYWRHHPHGLLSDGTRTDYHLAALLVIERRAFWPYLFANLSQQPVELTPRYARLAEQTELLPDADFVSACLAGTATAMLDTALCGYDYLLMLEPAALPALVRCAPHRLTLITATNMAALFKVKPELCNVPVREAAPRSVRARVQE